MVDDPTRGAQLEPERLRKAEVRGVITVEMPELTRAHLERKLAKLAVVDVDAGPRTDLGCDLFTERSLIHVLQRTTSSSLEVKRILGYRQTVPTTATDELLSIGAVSERTGVASSALRFYETEGLVHSVRSSGGQRRYHRDVIRRVSFIRIAQEVGLSLTEIHQALSSLPDHRTPTQRDWHRLATSWGPRLDAQIAMLERLRDRIEGCIGCGCLSLQACRIMNPDDAVAARGPGPRYVIDPDDPARS